MKTPKLILFDYGQTLADEPRFEAIAGTRAVMAYAVRNPHGYTAEEVQAHVDAVNRDLGRGDAALRHAQTVEIPNSMFQNYIYQSIGIEIPLTPAEMDRIFWNAAAPAVPTDGVADFLALLRTRGIRTGVISNITYDAEIVRERIAALLPSHTFECILATSAYLFRKPHRRIFELALEKAALPPEDVWYIGDNYACDVEGARAAGLQPVWYIGATRKTVEPREDVPTARHWRDVAAMLDACEAK